MKRTCKNPYQQLYPTQLLIGLLILIAASCAAPSGNQGEETDAAVVDHDTLIVPEAPAPVVEPQAPVEAEREAPSPHKTKPQILTSGKQELPQAPKAIGSIGAISGQAGKIKIPVKSAGPEEQVYGGQMMVYAADSMVEHRVERVMALVRQQIDIEKAIESISQSMGISEGEVAGDSKVHDIKLSDSLRVSLVFHPDDFKLISDEAVYYRHFSRGYTQYFDWEIEPLSPGDKKLTIRIENYVDHSWNNFVSPQTINIRVKVNQSTLWTRLWDTLQDDPLWLLNKVLLPVLAFIAGLLATYIRKKLFGKKES